MDHPASVSRLAILEAIPIGYALARCDARFASAWWHWFFFAQPGKPEQAIPANPDAWYGGDPAEMGAEAYADFLASIHDPATVHGMIEDDRAGLGIDRQHDEDDRAADSVSRPGRVTPSGRALHRRRQTLTSGTNPEGAGLGRSIGVGRLRAKRPEILRQEKTSDENE
ncbi:hypothetical protein [Mesorhizobium sp. M0664]|uniref:hypothetical protein n=1 Tax=Mesorhizobium sp. M0664 TaxID=2956982 RepID=UPI00333D8CCF